MKNFHHPNQGLLHDEVWECMCPALRERCKNGWAALFRNTVLHELPAERLAEGKSDDHGRPTVGLYTISGLLLMQQMFDWTFDQTEEAFLARLDVRWALRQTLGTSISKKTIQRYHKVLQGDEDSCDEVFENVTSTLLKKLEISVQSQRLDSTHVLSDMAVIGRSLLFRRTITKLLRMIEKADIAVYGTIPEELRNRYIGSDGKGVFGRKQSGEERQQFTEQAARDMHLLIKQFADHDVISKSWQYLLLCTVFSQQCDVIEDVPAIRKNPGGNTIQNPSDPDATYCGNKGVGYKVHLTETMNETGEPNLVTSVTMAPACENDSLAFENILETLDDRGRLPAVLPADAGYGSDENVERAALKGIELVSPVPGGKQYDPAEIGYDQFQLNEDNTVCKCPAGHAPKSSTFHADRGQVWAQMDKALCQSCPLLAYCGVQRTKSTKEPNGRINFRLKAIRCAARRYYEQTEEFRKKYRLRAGIESLNSALKRRMGLKRLRGRGKKAMRHAVTMKLSGWNILRAVEVCNYRKKMERKAMVSG
ncbi:MAG: hypothetical protein RIT02_965 [Planctomycetota bacterium]